jgi:8-oxo-dGTP pyrophosphatase MutT (NUDIX family)
LVATPKLLESIVPRLTEGEPIRPAIRSTAGVAIIFKPTQIGEEILLIRRAERDGDPWSGQIAFPGGRVEPEDSSFMATAARETAEEVGIDVAASSVFLGYMGSFNPMNRSISIVPSVFLLNGDVLVRPNAEVSSYRWLRFSEFLEERNRSTHKAERASAVTSFPSFKVGDYVVWGLTERILSTLLSYTQNR